MSWKFLCFNRSPRGAAELRPTWREVKDPKVFVKERIEPSIEMPKCQPTRAHGKSHFRQIARNYAEEYLTCHGVMKAISDLAEGGIIHMHLVINDYAGLDFKTTLRCLSLLDFIILDSKHEEWINIEW